MAEWRSNKVKTRILFMLSRKLPPEDVDIWSDKWHNKRKNAKKHDIPFDLTFEQYVNKAMEAGIKEPERIGRNIGDFALGRIGDIGGYTSDNCRFITVEQNLQELIDNGGTERGHQKQRGVSRPSNRIGQTAETHEWIRIRATKIKGRTAKTNSDIASATEKQSLYFRLNSPSGELYVGHNVSKFCRDNSKNLNIPNQSNVSALCRGDKTSCKGWTGSYISKDEYDDYPGNKQQAY